jgi:hypothetical protein
MNRVCQIERSRDNLNQEHYRKFKIIIEKI